MLIIMLLIINQLFLNCDENHDLLLQYMCACFVLGHIDLNADHLCYEGSWSTLIPFALKIISVQESVNSPIQRQFYLENKKIMRKIKYTRREMIKQS